MPRLSRKNNPARTAVLRERKLDEPRAPTDCRCATTETGAGIGRTACMRISAIMAAAINT